MFPLFSSPAYEHDLHVLNHTPARPISFTSPSILVTIPRFADSIHSFPRRDIEYNVYASCVPYVLLHQLYRLFSFNMVSLSDKLGGLTEGTDTTPYA
jgi:hypothetical protein